MSLSARFRPRLLAAALSAALLVALLPAVALAAGPRTNSELLVGDTPVAAAIAWSQATFADGSATDVILGREDRFPDNLASGMLQGTLEAPLLLNPSTRLHDDVSAELVRLGAETVHILGGNGAIAESVEQALRSEGYATHRHNGATRIETAIAVAAEHAADADTAIVSRAFGTPAGDESAAWADALSAGGWAAEQGWPVLLTETDRLTSSLATYLEQSSIEKVFIAGGTSAVSSDTANAIAALGIAVERVSGPNRFDTALRVAARRGVDDATDTDRVILAEGEEMQAWAGGFAAAAHSALHDAPVVLANGDTLPPETEAFLEPGGDDTALWCGPFTTEAACDRGGELLDQAVTGLVTLDSATVAIDGAITGRVAPLDAVTGAAVSGDCVSAQDVALDAEGDFAVPVHGAAGATCSVTFSVAHDDGRTVEQAFTVTLTEATLVTAAPDLVRVQAVDSDANDVTLRFTFDEQVARNVADDADFAAMFRLVAPDTALNFGADRAVISDGVAGHVDATFSWPSGETLTSYELATVATVAGGAVQDRDTWPNPAGDFALKAVRVDDGRGFAPDLIAIGNPSGSGDSRTYRFTFDQPVTEAPTASGFVVVRADGSVVQASSASWSAGATSFDVTFPVSDPSRVRRAVVRSDATVCTTVQGMRRCAGLQALDIASSGETSLPDLDSLRLDVAADRVTYTFDEAAGSPEAARFAVVSVSGGQSLGTSIVGTTDGGRSVTVQFGAGIVDDSITRGGVLAGAVSAFGNPAGPDAVGFDRVYAAGTAFGPTFARATDEPTELLAGNTRHRVTFTFDQPVTSPSPTGAFTGLFLHSERGDRVATQGCVQLEATQIRCDFVFTDAMGDAVLASAERGAVLNDGGAAGGAEYPNHADAVRLPETD